MNPFFPYSKLNINTQIERVHENEKENREELYGALDDKTPIIAGYFHSPFYQTNKYKIDLRYGLFIMECCWDRHRSN